MLRIRGSRKSCAAPAADQKHPSRGQPARRAVGIGALGLAATLAAPPAEAAPPAHRQLGLAMWQQAAPAAPAAAPATPAKAPTSPAPTPATGQPSPAAPPAPAPAAAGDELGAARLSISTWAGQATPTSLADLLASAIRTSPALASALLDTEIAEGRIDEAAAIDDWLLDAELSASRTTGPDTNTLTASASLSRLVSSGATLSLGAQSKVADTDESVLGGVTVGGTTWTDSITASISQPLLRGRGSALTYAASRRAELARDATRLGRQVSAIGIVQALVAAYWDLVSAEQEVAIAEASLGLAEERLRLTRAGIKGGKVADAEALAVEQAIATRTEELLSAELAVVDRSIALRRQAGLPIEPGALALRVDAAVGASDRGWDMSALLSATYGASPELARLAADAKTIEIDVEVTRDGMLPRLDAALSLTPLGIASSAGAALENLVTVEDYAVSASLTYQQALGARAAKGRLRSAQGQLDKLRVNEADLKQQLAQSLTRAVGQAELARRRALLAQRAIELSQRNIEVELTRFGLGKSTNFDVLQRQDELKQARLRHVRALIDWRKSEAAVMALTGELLPFYGIALQ